MMTEPQGPIYMCYDAGIQEAPLTENIRLPDAASAKRPSRMAPEMVSLGEIADRLIAAEWPVLLPQYVGRVPGGFGDMVALAETTGAAVSDVQSRLNFPTEHPLDCRMNREVFKTADVILALDCRDWERPTHYNDRINRTLRAHYPDHCQWMDIGFADIEISKWAMGYQKFPECAVRVLADTELAIPALTQLCRERVAKDKRAAANASRSAPAKSGKSTTATVPAGAPRHKKPGICRRFHSRVSRWKYGSRSRREDWVLTTQAFEDWALKLWDFDRHYRWPGKALGTGTQIGMAIGVALAHRGKGRLVVDCQTDGDLMFDAGALWFAAKHQVPLLCVMHNNRAYYNDWEHQITVARQRATPEERAYIGMDISGSRARFRGTGAQHGLVCGRAD